MTRAQVDMFEVQLGLAMLLQFRIDDRHCVTVLADAGVSASAYPPDHVHSKLDEAFAHFGNPRRRIDLIIGTHYDADHLDGLVPIINDPSIEIGEAWMPPVANDTEWHALQQSVQDRHLLCFQFAEADRDERLERYLAAKRSACDELGTLEILADSIESKGEEPEPRAQRSEIRGWDDPRAYFESHFRDANVTLGVPYRTHADDDVPDDSADEALRTILQASTHWLLVRMVGEARDASGRLEKAKEYWTKQPGSARAHARTLAHLRQSEARDAITADSLSKVIAALTARRIPICSHIIADGKPRQFCWKPTLRRFVGSPAHAQSPLAIQLLGPSESRVKLHCRRIPMVQLLQNAFRSDIELKDVTPSNQLSYVARLSFQGQGLLVCGDAGFVDFAGPGRKYFPPLLEALVPLHVVQVAHHGGRNWHFYRVLLAAGLAEQKQSPWLLLSHATNDRFRPSREFGLFIEDVVRKAADLPRLLFTSRPRPAHVHGFEDLIYPVVGPEALQGDVRLVFNKRKWHVAKHAVRL